MKLIDAANENGGAKRRDEASSQPAPATHRASPLPPGDHDANPAGISFPQLIAEDFATHGRSLTSAGFWALAVHRFGNWRMGIQSPLMRAPFSIAYRAAYHAAIAVLRIDLPYNVCIGRRLRIQHGGCVVVGAWKIGDDVILRGPVTIGLSRRDELHTPVLGHGVEVGPRACIVGNVHVGDGAFVAPCTVLTEDLPAGGAALGNPCRRVNPVTLEAR